MSRTKVWIDTHAVGFGSVGFMVIGSGQWASEALTVTRRVPGGNRFITQYLGRGPETATYEIKFGSPDDFHRFKTMLGTSDVLTLPADVSALTNRNPAVIGGVAYDRLTGVVLDSIDPSSVTYLNGGVVSCSATFLRDVDDEPAAVLWMEG